MVTYEALSKQVPRSPVSMKDSEEAGLRGPGSLHFNRGPMEVECVNPTWPLGPMLYVEFLEPCLKTSNSHKFRISFVLTTILYYILLEISHPHNATDKRHHED